MLNDLMQGKSGDQANSALIGLKLAYKIYTSWKRTRPSQNSNVPSASVHNNDIGQCAFFISPYIYILKQIILLLRIV